MSGPKTLSTALGRMRCFGAFWRRHGVPEMPEIAAGPAYDLTTFEQPLAAMVNRLVDMIVGHAEPASVNIEGRLVVRGAT